MTLSMILNSADYEFERLAGEMNEQELIGIMHEMIAEMDMEQKNFDSLSNQIDSVRDQASAEFKDVSSELVKSQNKLALLMSRNMFCFNLKNQAQNSTAAPPEAIVVKQTKPASKLVSTGESQRKGSTSSTTSKRKVVKVTRVVTRKVITETDDIDPQLKSIMESRRNNIKNYTNQSKNSLNETAELPKSSETHSSRKSISLSQPSPPTANHSMNGHETVPTEIPVVSDDSDTLPVTNIDDIGSTLNGECQSQAMSELTLSQSAGDDAAAVSDTDTVTSSEAALDLVFDFNSNDFEVEKVKERIFLKSWNPVKILDELYAVRLAKEISNMRTEDVVNIEGYLEQLPVGKKKTTLLKTWKRVYCKAKDGIIYFYKSRDKKAESSSYLSIMGGVLEELPGRMIGIDDKRGHYLMVRCPSDSEHRDWLKSLYTQIRCSPAVGYIRPSLKSAPHPAKVVVIDLGSCSVRAGLLGVTPSYPQIFMPCVTTTDKAGRRIFGNACYDPDNRVHGLQYPVATNKKVDKYRVNVHALHELFSEIFDKLGVTSSEHTVMLSTPHNFSSRLKQEVVSVLFDKLSLVAVNMVNQPLLTPYIYNATSGIVVDIGQRIEIVAITDGYLVEGGSSRRSYGGSQITDNLNSSLIEYRLFTAVEHLITRMIKEKTCFISQDYEDDLLECMGDSSQCQASISLEQFDLPEGAHLKLISVDSARFKAPEGLIKSELLGDDSPTLPQLIQQAVSKCPMDSRREMWQSIYLSGGTTLLEGFPERLEAELNELTPPTVTVQVHASVHRYHAAYIGACMLATLPNFKQSCITKQEWTSQGKASLNKWKHYFQGA